MSAAANAADGLAGMETGGPLTRAIRRVGFNALTSLEKIADGDVGNVVGGQES